jgi:hypothetical protein
VPGWAVGNNVISINGSPYLGPIVPGEYTSIAQNWNNGDVIDCYFPASIRFEQLNDYRPAFQGVGAFMYGGLLLAGLTSSTSFPVDLAKLPLSIVRNPGEMNLTLTATSECGTFQMIPLMDVMNEAYTVYFSTSNNIANSVGYNASGFSVLDGNNFIVSGGASITPNGNDVNIRSGNPGDVSSSVYSTAIQDNSHSITGFNFTYQYVSGYGASGAPGGANFSLVLSEMTTCGTKTVAVLYNSPVLSLYPFDQCNTCYSPPQVVYVPPNSFNVPVTNSTVVELIIQNNQRNIQLLLPMPITVFWQ